jgi:hypothetical protein
VMIVRRSRYRGLGGKVPIGLVTADWGGEPIEPFMSAEALADKTCGGTKPAGDAAVAAAAAAAETVPHSSSHGVPLGSGSPSTIWNGMIAPLRKMRFASAVWYAAVTGVLTLIWAGVTGLLEITGIALYSGIKGSRTTTPLGPTRVASQP